MAPHELGELELHTWWLSRGDARGLDDRWLSDEEEDRARRFATEELRVRFTTAHLGLRWLIASYSGIHPAKVVIRRRVCTRCKGLHGKPSVDGPVRFSMAHADDVVLYGISRMEVGVDVERREAVRDATMLRSLLSPRESHLLAKSRDPQLDGARLWVRKEALVKATGEGLNADLARIDVCVTPAVIDERWTVIDVPAPPNYLGAAAVEARRVPCIVTRELVISELTT